jgi:hypothetical protein
MKTGIKTLIVMFICSLSMFIGISIAKEKKPIAPVQETPGVQQVYLMPDLVVENITIERVSADAKRHTVKIHVTVKNNGGSTSRSLTPEGRARTCGGASKALVEWTENPTKGFNFLCESGISALAGGASQTFFCNDTIPTGSNRKYRATADHLNWIAESNEGNNINAAGYVAH